MNIGLNSADIEELRQSFTAQIKSIKVAADLEIIRRDWMSRDGIVRSLFKRLKDIPADDKPLVAEKLNGLKDFIESTIGEREDFLVQERLNTALSEEFLDLSLPGATAGLGALHPITLIEQRIASILRPFGIENVLGPEIETEYYCFDALNIPKHHPARDMQDTFYTDSGHVLRTHTTSVQARILEARSKHEGRKLPIKIASFGRVYRNETEDASHQAMFHQFDLVWVEEGATLAQLMGLITHILKELYGKRCKVRFVPKYYPYTEPSIGPQVDCTLCHGSGCPACGGAGWVTVAGAGMIHSKVLKEFNFDPGKVSGFAFGAGTARLAAQMFNIPKLKMLYDNDLRLFKELL